MNKIGRTVSSLEIAEWVEREHKHVMRDIRNILEHLELGQSKFGPSNFIESKYENTQGKLQPCYLLTKKACELYGTRMNGYKGTQFAAKYIEKFNEMEQQLFMQNASHDPISLALEVTRDLHEKFGELERTFKSLQDNMRISSAEEFMIKQLGKMKAIEVLGGTESVAYSEFSRKVFSCMWGDFKRHFLLPRHSDLPRVKLEEAKRFLKLWRPKTSLAMEIENANGGMENV